MPLRNSAHERLLNMRRAFEAMHAVARRPTTGASGSSVARLTPIPIANPEMAPAPVTTDLFAFISPALLYLEGWIFIQCARRRHRLAPAVESKRPLAPGSRGPIESCPPLRHVDNSEVRDGSHRTAPWRGSRWRTRQSRSTQASWEMTRTRIIASIARILHECAIISAANRHEVTQWRTFSRRPIRTRTRSMT